MPKVVSEVIDINPEWLVSIGFEIDDYGKMMCNGVVKHYATCISPKGSKGVRLKCFFPKKDWRVDQDGMFVELTNYDDGRDILELCELLSIPVALVAEKSEKISA